MIARDVMSHPVITVAPQTRIEDVVERLLSYKIGAVVVVDENESPVGVVSESDLLYKVAHFNLPPHIELLGSIIYLDTPGHIHERQQKASAVYARDLMSDPPVTVQADTPVEDIADLLIGRKIHRVLVVEDGRLTGIVTRGDVVRHALARQWPTRPQG